MAVFRGERQKAIRLARNLTRAQLATPSEVSLGMIVKIERDEVRPSIATLCRIAKVLDAPIEDFFDDADPDLAADDDPRPSNLGPDVDEWIKRTAAAMPMMDAETAQRVSAALFVHATDQAVKSRRRRARAS